MPMSDFASVLTGGGVGSGFTAIVAGLIWWRKSSGDYARVASEISRQVAQDLRKDNAELKTEQRQMRADMAELDRTADRLRERLLIMIGLIDRAIPRLESAGVDVTEYREAVRGGPV